MKANRSDDYAQIHDVNKYMESFYDENLETKVNGARKVLLLFLEVQNFQPLIEHGNSFIFFPSNQASFKTFQRP